MTNAKAVEVRCTFTACTAKLLPAAAWLPEVAAMRRASGGKRVEVMDFPRFALCSRHGAALREQGVKVYRYEATVAHLRNRAEQRETETLAVKAFAARFAPKANERGGQPKRRLAGDGRNVGGGLRGLAKIDEAKLLAQRS